MFSLYSTLRDLHFCMPGGWNDKYLKIFIQACRIHFKDLKVKDNKNRWHNISEFGAKVSENAMLFSVNSCMEVAESIRSYIEHNRTKKANDSIFSSFLSEVEDLLEYFPTQPKKPNVRSMSTDNSDATTSVACELDDSSSEELLDFINKTITHIKENEQFLWTEISERINEVFGIKCDIEEFLKLKKEKVISEVMKEDDPDKRKAVFCEAASKLMTIFDFIQPTSIQKSFFLNLGDTFLGCDVHLLNEDISPAEKLGKGLNTGETINSILKDESLNIHKPVQDSSSKQKRGRHIKVKKDPVNKLLFHESEHVGKESNNKNYPKSSDNTKVVNGNVSQHAESTILQLEFVNEGINGSSPLVPSEDNPVGITEESHSAIGHLGKKHKSTKVTISYPIVSSEDILLPSDYCATNSSDSNKSSKLLPLKAIGVESTKTLKHPEEINNSDKQKYEFQEPQTSKNCKNNPTSERTILLANLQVSSSKKNIENVSDKQRPFKKRGIPPLIDEVQGDLSLCIDSANDVVAIKGGYLKRAALDDQEVEQEASKLLTSEKHQHPTDPVKDSGNFQIFNNPYSTTQDIQPPIKRKRGRPPKNDKIMIVTKSFQPSISGSLVDKNRPFKKRDISQFHQEMLQQDNNYGQDDLGERLKNNEIALIGESRKRKIKYCETEIRNKSLITSAPDISISVLDNKRKSEINLNPVVKLVDIMLYPNSFGNLVISNTKYTQIKNKIKITDQEKVTASVQPAKKSKSVFSINQNNIASPDVQDKTKKEDLVEAKENKNWLGKQNLKRRRGRLSKEELRNKMDWEIKNFKELIRKIGEDPSLFNFNYPYPKWFQKKWREYELHLRLENSIPVWQSEYLQDWKLVIKEWKKYREQDKSIEKSEGKKNDELLRQRVERVTKRQKARDHMAGGKNKSITARSRKKKVTEKNISKTLPHNNEKRKAGGWQPGRVPGLIGGLPQMKRLPIPSVGGCGLPPAILLGRENERPPPRNVGENFAAMGTSGNSPGLMATLPIICEMEPEDYNENEEQVQSILESMGDEFVRETAFQSTDEPNWFPNFTKRSFEMQECIVQYFKDNQKRDLEKEANDVFFRILEEVVGE